MDGQSAAVYGRAAGWQEYVTARIFVPAQATQCSGRRTCQHRAGPQP